MPCASGRSARRATRSRAAARPRAPRPRPARARRAGRPAPAPPARARPPDGPAPQPPARSRPVARRAPSPSGARLGDAASRRRERAIAKDAGIGATSSAAAGACSRRPVSAAASCPRARSRPRGRSRTSRARSDAPARRRRAAASRGPAIASGRVVCCDARRRSEATTLIANVSDSPAAARGAGGASASRTACARHQRATPLARTIAPHQNANRITAAITAILRDSAATISCESGAPATRPPRRSCRPPARS